MRIFATPLSFGIAARCDMFPLEFRSEVIVTHEDSHIGLSYSKDRIYAGCYC